MDVDPLHLYFANLDLADKTQFVPPLVVGKIVAVGQDLLETHSKHAPVQDLQLTHANPHHAVNTRNVK